MSRISPAKTGLKELYKPTSTPHLPSPTPVALPVSMKLSVHPARETPAPPSSTRAPASLKKARETMLETCKTMGKTMKNSFEMLRTPPKTSRELLRTRLGRHIVEPQACPRGQRLGAARHLVQEVLEASRFGPEIHRNRPTFARNPLICTRTTRAFGAAPAQKRLSSSMAEFSEGCARSCAAICWQNVK